MEREFKRAGRWCEEHDYGSLVAIEPAGGGCINRGAVLETESGASFFAKMNDKAPPDMFPKEAEGLQALQVEGGPRVPEVYHAGAHFILLENLDPGPHKSGYWPQLGRELAALHRQSNDQFGFHHHNYIGSTPQKNPWMEDGFEFFARYRLLYQARLGRDRGHLSTDDVRRVESIANRLQDLVPAQDPALIHGDLWSGNVITDREGNPAIIDPATHYGWAEAELAMTGLFGRFPAAFYEAYGDHYPLEPGVKGRFPIYNLYHLLNHVNLFGGGYLSQVRSVLSKYT